MKRWFGLLSLVGLLASAAVVQAQETHTVKIKKTATGDSAKIEKKDESSEGVRVTDNDGNKIAEETKKKAAHYIYTETILEKIEGAKRPIRVKRVYEKAVVKTEEGNVELAFQGKTVLIEKKDGRYHFTYDNDQPIPGAAAKHLDEEFNKKDKDDDGGLHEVLLPMKDVKVGDSWALPAEEIGKHMEEKDGKVKFDHDKSKGTGKLLKVYKQDGQQFGVMQMRLELVPLSFKGDDGNEIKVQPDSRLVIDLKIDGCIDGSSLTSKMEVGFTVNAVAHIPPDNPQMRFVLNLRATSNVNGREVKK